ncbi:TonB-dependent receptor [Pedobacter sp. MC2016-24]|uniref:SusC/RagA family TonB-linked outer membrane protein n=1 Tax=Pedobacter sp. MC2016-24 TaxID=2780090 RepID=UPI00188235AC|nr:TonB-dependent receptor [Pedobacter sp. MC2016-24]MBE9601525.1 TonB-dependent receptor [Pedobacter sp. MC2016-24]
MEKSFTNLCTKKFRASEGLRKIKYYTSYGFLLLLLQFFSLFASAQEKTLSGTVIDAEGGALPGVSVQVKNTKSGTTTSAEGKFSISVPSGTSNPVLVFSFIGYTKKEVEVGSQTTFNITLQVSDNELSEVVVVGYGTQKKETLTGSVAVVSAKSFENKGALASPLQALQGQVPGAIITRGSGAPGDESWGIKLRSAVSVKSVEPLVIIDGIAYDSFRELRLINPSDIDNISFLKDAAASIYGSRAAGGVMLVTTKKGKSGKAAVEFSSLYSYKKPGLQPRLMSMDEWANGVITARTNDGLGENDVWIRYAKLALQNKGGYIDARDPATAPIPSAFTDVKDFVFLDNNWTDILWGGAGTTQNDLSISGRTEKAGYRLSAGYLFDEGTLRWGNNTNKRYNFRLNNDFQISDRFTIESVISYSNQNQVIPTMIGNTLGQGYPQPGFPSATLNGKPYAWGGQYTPNWFAELGGDNQLKVKSTNISENFKFKVTNELQWVTTLGMNFSTAIRDVQQNTIDWYNYEGDLLIQSNPNQANSSYAKSTASTDFYSASTYLNYVKTFKGEHNVSATLGGQYEFNDYDSYNTKILDINSSLSTINGAGVVTSGATRNQYAIGSYYSRLNYNYKNRYLFEVNGRYDGSSKFARQNRWNLFYGFSGGWRVGEESFMKDLKIFDELKLRASYGIVGNQTGIDLYDGVQLYNQSSGTGAYLGTGKVTYVTTNGKLVSYDRTWERNHNYNVALDFALLKSRLSGTLEYFLKKNNNMFLSAQYSAVLGANAPEANIGKLSGKGYEATLNWSDRKGDFSYNIGGVFTYAENKIVDYGGVSVLSSGGRIGALQGFPLNSIVGLEYDGKIQNEEQRTAYFDKYLVGNTIGLTNAIRVGDNMYKDSNGDGKLTYDDLVYLGTDDPKISYSFNLGGSYKGFDCSIIFQGATARTIFRDDVNWRQPFRSVYLNTTNQSVNNNWTPENTTAFFPRYSTDGVVNTYNYQASSWSVENGSYLRLKNIVLGYTLPESVIKKTKAFSKLRIYVAGQDLWETTKINDGWDPEATRTVSSGIQRYPFSRAVTVGLNAAF